MVPNKVALILCGGDINFSDLPIITNRSNAMIPVNGKPVIGWIMDDLLQKGIDEVILVLRFDNYKLFNYVEWAFAKRTTVHYAFVQAGGTILHSLLAGLAWVKPTSGVHIILGDTLLRDRFPADPDFIFSAAYENPEDWCLVKTDHQGIASEYLDKLTTHRTDLKAVAGVYSFADTTLLRQVVMRKIRDGSRNISDVLKDYGRARPIKVIDASEWYDFGHISYFNLAKRKLLQSRYFNSLTIDPVRGTISKTSEKADKLADELLWYQSLPPHLQLLTPRLIDTQGNGLVAITQEYYGYPNLAELYVFGDISLSVWMNALKRLMEVHLLFRNEKGKIDSADVADMYWEKTRLRMTELRQDPYWQALTGRPSLTINGQACRNFGALESSIKNMADQLGERPNGSIIHGDYCFSNILYDLNSQLVRLIDPRGSFGKQKKYGDPRYDIAKLRHSISGRYDFIVADLFRVSEYEGDCTLQLYEPDVYSSVTSYFDELIRQHGYDDREIAFIEGLLFVSMVPLHKDNFQRQLAMYLNGILILNKVFS